MIARQLFKTLQKHLHDKKVIVLLGPRQAGKTTFLKEYYLDDNTLWLDGDDVDVRALLTNRTSGFLGQLVKGKHRVIIDEAQNIPDIGLLLKRIHDYVGGVKVIVTGSSAFEIVQGVSEPLTGRKWEYPFYPINIPEMIAHHGLLTESRLLEHRLVFGMYPEVINHPADAVQYLQAISTSYLYKDILKWQEIKKPAELEKLVQALAFQVGKEVSYNELGQLTGLTNETVQRYIDLLEKSFVVFSLSSFSRNLRNEIKRGKKIFFIDNGVRNTVIKQYQSLSLRQDTGALWENFVIMERRKYKALHHVYTNDYFWRTHAQQEIDYIEDYDGVLHAYEIKWNPERKQKTKVIPAFAAAYPRHTFHIVSRDNYLDFIEGRL